MIGTGHLGDANMYGRIILKRNLEEQDTRM